MIRNLILETCNAPGTTATINLLGPVAGRLGWLQAFTSGSQVLYFLDDGALQEWGLGAVTAGAPNTLSRSTVLGNSSGTTARLNFPGITRVYNEIPAEKSIYIDGLGIIQSRGGTFDRVRGPGSVPIGVPMPWAGTDAACPGWCVICDGRTFLRSTPLFAILGTAYGAGNGTTTVNTPDMRGRDWRGADNMGGTAAGRVTSASMGVAFVRGQGGGDERLANHNHGVSDPAHSHGVFDPGHAHSLYDPTHNHGASNGAQFMTSKTTGGGFGTVGGTNENATYTTNVSTGMSVYAATTGIATYAAVTGVTTQNAGGGTSLNMPPTMAGGWILDLGI